METSGRSLIEQSQLYFRECEIAKITPTHPFKSHYSHLERDYGFKPLDFPFYSV